MEKLKYAIGIALLLFMCDVHIVKAEVITPVEIIEEEKYVYERYEMSHLLESTDMGANEIREVNEEYEVNGKYIYSVRFVFKDNGSACCHENNGKVEAEESITIFGSDTVTGIYIAYFNPISNTDTARVIVHGAIKSNDVCSTCGKTAYKRLAISDLMVARRKPYLISSNIQNVNIAEGDSFGFSVQAECTDSFRWQRGKDGYFTDLYDGVEADGTVITGSDTDNIMLTNVGKGQDGYEYRCILTGVHDYKTESSVGVLSVTAGIEPTPTPVITPEPTPVITPEPTRVIEPTYTPTPGPNPTKTPVSTVTPTPTQITIPNQPSGSSSNGPSSSSTSYRPNTTPTGGSTDTSSSSRTSSSSSNNSSSDTKIIWEDDIEDDNPGFPNGGGSSRNGASSSGKNNSSSAKGNSYSNRNSSSNSNGNSGKNHEDGHRYNSTRNGSGVKTIMKDGVLYIVDENDEEYVLDAEDTFLVEEEFVLDNEYAPGDLMNGSEPDLISAEGRKYGLLFYLAVILGAILFLLLLLFILFFGVIVEGECEENDDVFDICAIRMIYRKDGNWCINLKEVFEENAAVRLRIGILFAVIFKDFEMTCYVEGINSGIVTGEIKQKMMLYRKKIRRTI